MVTVQHLVRKMMAQRPFVAEALSHGVINIAALAQMLMPDLEKELGKKVTFAAVNMAVRRLAEEAGTIVFRKPRFDKDADITMKSQLAEITIYRTEDIQQHIKRLYEIVNMRQGDFLTITQGLHEVTIFTNARHVRTIQDIVPARSIKKIIGGISSITIALPPQAIDTIGYFFVVTRALAWDNINIVDVVSTYTEMTYMVKDQDASRAFDCLRNVIKVFS